MLLMTRIMGRKDISQITFFNFVSAIAIGSLGANLAVSQNLSIRNGVLALIGWGSVVHKKESPFGDSLITNVNAFFL
jgi:uncharacterized membrane protein YcaP (DUF421 family)